MYAADGDEARVFGVCSDLENYRIETPLAYKMLQKLIEFASKPQNNAEGLAELISHPPQLSPSQGDVKFVIENRERIFNEPSVDDVNYSRCRPPNVRRVVQMAHKAATIIQDK